jgi:hypothetical protein
MFGRGDCCCSLAASLSKDAISSQLSGVGLWPVMRAEFSEITPICHDKACKLDNRDLHSSQVINRPSTPTTPTST